MGRKNFINKKGSFYSNFFEFEEFSILPFFFVIASSLSILCCIKLGVLPDEMTSSVNIIMFIYTKAMFGFFQVIQFFLEPKICIKYRKHGRFYFSSIISYFEPKKYILKPKLTSMLINFLTQTLQCAELQILCFFWP